MAGDWLKIETVTPDKPEVLRMANELDIDPDAVFGKLFRVWAWFDAHSEDGNAPSVTEMLLNRIVGVSGFVTAMINVGWMIKTESGLKVPEFDKHNGESAKKRANTARRVAKHKNKKQNSNAESVTEVTPEVLPNALPREEKRREDILLSLRGEICKALTQIGLAPFNASNPKLTPLIEAGVPVQEFIDTAQDIKNNKPEKFSFDYIIATVAGRRRDAANMNVKKGNFTNNKKSAAAKSIFNNEKEIKEVKVIEHE